MDALKSAGRAIVRSPSAAKQSWTSGRHRKLPENWTDTREAVVQGMTFNLRRLGMTLVDQPKGEELSAAAVKRIVATAKAGGKKPQKVSLTVSPQGVALHDGAGAGGGQLLEEVSIYRISYCTVDKLHDKVFAYIAQTPGNGTLECHAYLCPKRKVAQAVALTVAQAFSVAFELWQAAKEEKGKRAKCGSAGEAGSSQSSESSDSVGSLKGTDVATDNLLDFEDAVASANENGAEDHLVQLLDALRPPGADGTPACETEDGLDEAFSRLAVSRTNPQLLDIGVTPQDWLSEPDWDANGNSPSGASPPWGGTMASERGREERGEGGGEERRGGEEEGGGEEGRGGGEERRGEGRRGEERRGEERRGEEGRGGEGRGEEGRGEGRRGEREERRVFL